MSGGGRGSGQIARPIAVDGTRQVAAQIVPFGIALEREAAIDDADLRVTQLRGCLLGGQEEIWAREWAHVSDFSRSHATAMRRTV